MLKVFILFLLLIAGIVLGPMIAGHQGYVLIQTDNWNIETSVTGLAIILIVALLVILAVEWLLRRLFRTGARTRGWRFGSVIAATDGNKIIHKIVPAFYQILSPFTQRRS